MYICVTTQFNDSTQMGMQKNQKKKSHNMNMKI